MESQDYTKYEQRQKACQNQEITQREKKSTERVEIHVQFFKLGMTGLQRKCTGSLRGVTDHEKHL